MKSNSKYFIGIAIFIFSVSEHNLLAQTETIQYAICQNCNSNNPTMDPPINYTIDQISSDFGMRVARGATRFHLGIDYVSDAISEICRWQA
jgi:hypothetical protein